MATLETDLVLQDRHSGVATITLNRPQALNALNDELKIQLLVALRAVADDPQVRCVVLTGSGRAFCSGQDLKDAQTLSPGLVATALRQLYHPIIRLIYGMPKPVIAAVNGVAAGAGASLALACDLRLISDQASFTVAFSRIGLVPDCGISFFLPQLIGRGRALELAYTAESIGADEAVRIGLANHHYATDTFMADCQSYAERLASGPTVALGLCKRAINTGLVADLETTLEQEARSQQEAIQSFDAGEGIGAFLQKRAASFQGR